MRTILVNAQIRIEAHDGIPDEGVLRDLAQQLAGLSSLHGSAWRVETPADVSLTVGWSTPDGHHEPGQGVQYGHGNTQVNTWSTS